MVRAESITSTLVYTYNADGLRVAQSVDGAATAFVWDWAAGVPELLRDGDSLYLIGYDALGWQTGSDWRFVLPDALGSVRQETDAAGAVTAAREWTPYGEEVGAAQAGLGFTGEWFDAAVGLTYLRARWYDEQIGLFSSVDPLPGPATESLSLNSYLYVLANPINMIDPSGLYHKDLHYDATKQWALSLVRLFGVWLDAEKLAELIAEGNQYVDDSTELYAVPIQGCYECHFSPNNHIWEAIRTGNPFMFGAALHQAQDFYSHWNEGYTSGFLGHAWDSAVAGVTLDASPRTPGGKSNRSKLDLFFDRMPLEIRYGTYPDFPVYPKDDVVGDVQRRNPGLNLSGLTEDDLIDLFLRCEPEADLNWQTRIQDRAYYGLDPDAYIPGSQRDNRVHDMSLNAIGWFMRSIAWNPCQLDWKRPSAQEIRKLLIGD